jgi:hypothetical protein
MEGGGDNMKRPIVEEFEIETGLDVEEDGNGCLFFSAREIYTKLEVNGFGVSDSESPSYPFRKWAENNLLKATDSGGNLIFTNYRQVKRPSKNGRPSFDYLVDKETAKMIILRSNSPIGIETLRKIIRFEEAYSSIVKQRLAGRVTFLSLTDSIKAVHDPLRPYHFSNEVNMIYRIMFGMDAKQLKESRNVLENEDLRDYFTKEELKILQRLEMKNAVYIDDGMEFQERKMKLIQSLAELGRVIEG